MRRAPPTIVGRNVCGMGWANVIGERLSLRAWERGTNVRKFAARRASVASRTHVRVLRKCNSTRSDASTAGRWSSSTTFTPMACSRVLGLARRVRRRASIAIRSCQPRPDAGERRCDAVARPALDFAGAAGGGDNALGNAQPAPLTATRLRTPGRTKCADHRALHGVVPVPP